MHTSVHLLRKLPAIFFTCLVGFSSFAQELATNYGESIAKKLPGRTNSEQNQAISLDKVLGNLEVQYQIRFAYEDKTIENKFVELAKTHSLSQPSAGALKKILEEILQPLALSAKKVGEYYVVKEIKSSETHFKKIKPQTPYHTGQAHTASFSSLKKFSGQQLNLLLSAQEKNIQGKVTDAGDGAALPGVNILVKGTNIGTVTDVDGNYKITAPDNATVLVFSSVGFNTEEIPIGGRSVIDLALTPDIQALSEVIVTALGIKKETKKLGYATAKVEPEELTVNRTTNFMNSLQGKVAGVNISSLGTGVAGTSKIRIRGQSSFGGQNTPLFVVNGIPINNTNFGVYSDNGNRAGASSDGGDGLTSINPDDIESVTVLKGAAAAALYGSRAKDGVIMITTKTRGTSKGIGVEWNSNFTTDTPLDYTDYQYEYGQGENGVRPTSPNPTSGVWSFGEKFQPGMTQILFDGDEVPYAPVRDRIKKFYRTGTTWTNTVSVSSGGEKGGFNLSLSNLDNKSIVPNSNFNRKTINLGFTQDLSPKFNVSGSINYSIEDNENPPIVVGQDISTPVVIYSMSNSMPLDVLEANKFDANGDEFIWSRFRNRTNPYFALSQHFENIKRNRIFGNINMRYNLTDWLYVQGRVGQDYYSRDQDYNLPTGLAFLPAAPDGFVNGTYVQETRRFSETNADFLIGANREFGDFGIDVNFGGNRMYRRSDRNSVQVDNFVVRDLYTVRNGVIKNPIYDIAEWEVNSLYGAAEFSYKEFLYLNATARNDWFSTLSPANRSILYPSVTGSFVFSQAFPALPNWISFGKIRAGYAEVGSDLDVNPYSNALFYGVNSNLFPLPSGQLQPVGSISNTTVPNDNLRPMTVKEIEVGFDVRLFDNRVGVDFAYYTKTTSDQILSAQITDASGYTNSLINVGESRNNGVELLLNLVPLKTNEFNWDLTFNYAHNTTEVLKLGLNPGDTIISVGSGIRGELITQIVGKPMGQIFGFGFQYDDQGRQIFSENNGRPLRTDTQRAFGSAIPTDVGGIINSFNYKNLNLTFLVDFKLGHKMASGTNFNLVRHGLHKRTLVGREDGYVVGKGVNENGEINNVQTPIQTYYETAGASNIVEDYLYNAGFWSLRQVTFGYDFTRMLPESLFIKGLRLNVVANNVAILKKWVDNIHPEQLPSASDNLVGIEQTSLPVTRSIGFNLNVKF